MVNVIPPDHVDDVLVVDLDQHDDVPVIPEPILADEDKDPKEDEVEEEEDPQEEEDDMEVDIKEDKNEPELTYPYEEMDPPNPPPLASESEHKDAGVGLETQTKGHGMIIRFSPTGWCKIEEVLRCSLREARWYSCSLVARKASKSMVQEYATMIRHNKNLMDITIDALYNILKQNKGDFNVVMGLKKKTVVVTSYPIALIAEKTKSDDKQDDQKKRDTSKVKCYIYKKEGHFEKDYKKANVKDYEYYKTKMPLAKKDKDEQVLLAKDHGWKESIHDSDQKINANMVFIAQIEKVLSNSKASSSSAHDKIFEVSYYLSESKSEFEFETLEYYENTTTYGLFVNDNNDQEIFHDCENFLENLIESQIDHNGSAVDHNDSKGIDKNALCNPIMNASVDVDDLFVFDYIVQICLWIIYSGCSNHMTGNHSLLTNFVEKFLGTVRFGNNDFAVIAGYGDVIMKSSTTNLETSINDDVFHGISKSFQGESSSSSLNDDVQQSPVEVIPTQLNTQSISINMIPNGDEASTSHNVFNERLEDSYFDASTSFHDPSNVDTYYQPYPHEKKWTKDHPFHKIIGDPKSSVRTRGQLAISCLFSCLLSSIEPANVDEALRDADWVSAMQEELGQFTRLNV
nr:integrase, catalytic region, zinc finger, CCHC-type, peptidase aspartic, catalytic [Tanacetum cinerariifolium]